MVTIKIKKLLKEYRELKKKMLNKEISLKEFHTECRKKYIVINQQILKAA